MIISIKRLHSASYKISHCTTVLFLFLITVTTSLKAQTRIANGKVIGTVKDERNDVLPLVTIKVANSAVQLKSSVSGDYEISLAPGNYTLTFSFASLDSKEITDVIVKEGEVTKLDIVMTSGQKANLSGVVITAAKKESVASVLKIQKNNIAVSDVMSIEQIKRTPDNNVAEALRRINGVTIVDNKFVVVRGMGERYNNVLVNGSQLPSTEANKKNFSFDLIPANLIDNIIVNKTATPDLPADFAGGLVQVNTKDVPDKTMLTVVATGGYNTKSTFKDFQSTAIDRSEYYGKVDESRRWYLNKWDPVDYFKARSSSDISQFRKSYQMNSMIPNTWGLNRYQALPTQEYMINGGFRFRFKNKSSLGFIVGVNYRNEQTKDDYTQKTVFSDSVSGQRYHFATSIGGLATVAYNTGKHKFAFKNIYSRRLTHDNSVYKGIDTDLNDVQGYISDILTTGLLQNRLEGEHVLSNKGLKVKWFGDRSVVDREQPDTRAIRYRQTSTEAFPKLILDQSIVFYDLGALFATKLRENRYSWGGDVQIPVDFFKQHQKIKVGVLRTQRSVDFSSIALRPGLADEKYRAGFFGLPDYLTYLPENFQSGKLTYNPASTNSAESDADVYSGDQRLLALYAMGDLLLTDKLRFSGGLRAEDYELAAKSILKRDPSGKSIKDSLFGIKEFRLYPSFNIVYSLSDKSNLRAAFSKTVSRFDFREGSPLKYFDFVNYGSVFGNAKLKHASIFNYDLRYEIYPSSGEIISVSLFYKKFNNPIETFVVQGSNVKSYLYYYVNLKSSENTGIEIDLRKSFSLINTHSGFLKNLFLGGNASVMRSTVDVDRKVLYDLFSSSGGGANIDTVKSDIRKRPLQGLSPYAVNIYLLYQGEKMGFNIAYNKIGRRLVFASPDDFQDVFENPRNVFDLQLYARLFRSRLEIKFNASDLLNDPFIQYNNSVSGSAGSVQNTDPKGKSYNPEYDFLYNRVQRGRSFSFSLNYKIL